MDDLNDEMLDAARFGDADEMIALLERGAQVDARGRGGNTACHMAAANGHERCVSELIARGAAVDTRNDAGNLALHYAVQQRQIGCLKLLLECEAADVLAKNTFGRCVLTEAIATGDGELASLVLEHASATEERIVEGLSGGDHAAVTHAFRFGAPSSQLSETQLQHNVVSIRELQITKSVEGTFGLDGNVAADRTGLGVWASSLVLAQWLVAESERFANATVLELGAGCGAPGIALAAHADNVKVVLTDANADALANAKHNVESFFKEEQHTTEPPLLADILAAQKRLAVAPLDWRESTDPCTCDVVIGADLVYCEANAKVLAAKVAALAPEFWYVAPDDLRAGAQLLISILTEDYDLTHTVSDAPAEFCANPYARSDDQPNFLLYFPDMATTHFKLHHFRRETGMPPRPPTLTAAPSAQVCPRRDEHDNSHTSCPK